MVVLKDGGRDRENVTEPTNISSTLAEAKTNPFQVCKMLSPSILPDMRPEGVIGGAGVTLGGRGAASVYDLN
jgi:hypothetical protein